MGRTLSDAEKMIREEKPFVISSGNLRAYRGPWNGQRGFLPEEWHTSLRSARYVIYSYGTPIAWITDDGSKVLPDIGYTPTTSQHQYAAATALGIDHRPARGRPVVRVPANAVRYGRPRRLRRGGIDA